MGTGGRLGPPTLRLPGDSEPPNGGEIPVTDWLDENPSEPPVREVIRTLPLASAPPPTASNRDAAGYIGAGIRRRGFVVMKGRSRGSFLPSTAPNILAFCLEPGCVAHKQAHRVRGRLRTATTGNEPSGAQQPA